MEQLSTYTSKKHRKTSLKHEFSSWIKVRSCLLMIFWTSNLLPSKQQQAGDAGKRRATESWRQQQFTPKLHKPITGQNN